jgi:hypothetical protein
VVASQLLLKPDGVPPKALLPERLIEYIIYDQFDDALGHVGPISEHQRLKFALRPQAAELLGPGRSIDVIEAFRHDGPPRDAPVPAPLSPMLVPAVQPHPGGEQAIDTLAIFQDGPLEGGDPAAFGPDPLRPVDSAASLEGVQRGGDLRERAAADVPAADSSVEIPVTTPIIPVRAD